MGLLGDHGPHVIAALFDRTPADFELGMEYVPDMDHLRPNLQVYTHISRTGDLGQPDRVVEQGLGRTDLDQQGR